LVAAHEEGLGKGMAQSKGSLRGPQANQTVKEKLVCVEIAKDRSLKQKRVEPGERILRIPESKHRWAQRIPKGGMSCKGN